MKNFDFQRFGRVLRLDFAESRGTLLWFSLGGLTLYLFFFWFAHNIGMKADVVNDWEWYIKDICKGVFIFSILAMYISFLASANTLYWAEQKKAKRTAHLMLPATNLEKFLARWIYQLVFSVVVGLLPFFVADGIHIAWLWLTGKPVASTTTYFLNTLPRLSSINKDYWLNGLMDYSALVVGHAFFLLGGIVFRKCQFVATALVGIVAFITFAHFTTHDQPYMQAIPYDWYYLGMSLFFFALICVFTVLAYRLYCRWQVATRNYVNLP